jgi:methylmalonyl-CoA mutase C-terminal domain/subunit
MEVIYTGIRQPVESILKTAVQESVDVIGLSILSGSHLPICKELTEKMQEKSIDDKVILAGGIIPKKDVTPLKEMGVAEIFRPNATIGDIARFIQDAVEKRREGQR